MSRHEAVEQTLASYRDASAKERAQVEAHLAACPACRARLAAYDQTDALLSAAPQPTPPARLSGPFAALLSARSPRLPARHALAFARGFAPAAVVLFLLVALSVVVWSVNTEQAPITVTPTLTTTLTPTSISARGAAATSLAALTGGAGRDAPPSPAFVPTPAPAPGPGGRQPGILFVASGAHATISH